MKKKRNLLFTLILIVGLCTQPTKAAETTITYSELLTEDFQSEDVVITVHENANDFIEVIENDSNMCLEDKERLIAEVEADQKQRSTIYKYHTFRHTVPVTSSYSCYPYFYVKCEYYSSTDVVPYRMNTIMYGNIDRNHNGTSKLFDGTLYYNLESGNRYYFDLNGDFYNNGTFEFGGGGEAQIGEHFTANFTVSYSSSWYAYKQYSGIYHSAAMKP